MELHLFYWKLMGDMLRVSRIFLQRGFKFPPKFMDSLCCVLTTLSKQVKCSYLDSCLQQQQRRSG